MPRSTSSQLRWPRQIFAAEALQVLDGHGFDDVVQLLREAFVDSGPADEYQRRKDPSYVSDLVRAAGDLTESTMAPPPSFSERKHGVDRAPLSARLAAKEFVRLIEDLVEDGYMAQAWGKHCPDDATSRERDPREELELRLGRPELWPLHRSVEDWDEETFLDLIEVFHDLVARPRHRSWHSWNNCGWHWSDYSTPTGQGVYRWRINRLLGQTDLGYELAGSGEDVGRLVAKSPDARADLLETMVERTDDTGDRVRHAIALFRARGADEHDKRSAIIVLAGILEERRTLLDTALFRRDEGALFQIANEFGLRHQREGQKTDYDVVFLDWVYWWYLATIELTDRLLDRQGGGR